MPYKDPEQARQSNIAAKKRHRAKKHQERFGPDAGDMRGRHGNHARAASHPRWKQGLAIHQDGYIKVQVGVKHPMADPNGYAYLHRLVVAAAGVQLASEDIVHHINGDKQDNRWENLEVTTRSEHTEHHNGEKPRDGAGRFVGKARAGALLDGREWREFPEVRQ